MRGMAGAPTPLIWYWKFAFIRELSLVQGCPDQPHAGGMMSTRFSCWCAWRSPDWPSGQDARDDMRALWTSPRHLTQQVGAGLSVRISSARRLDRRPVCLRRRSCDLRADRPVTPAWGWSGHPQLLQALDLGLEFGDARTRAHVLADFMGVVCVHRFLRVTEHGQVGQVRQRTPR